MKQLLHSVGAGRRPWIPTATLKLPSCVLNQIVSSRYSRPGWRGRLKFRHLEHIHLKSRNRFYALTKSLAKREKDSDVFLTHEDVLNQEEQRSPESSGSGDVSSEEVGTLNGAIALIIGTSVGAGILAIPERTLDVGFIPTVTTMGICWCFLVLEALLLAEINVALLKDQDVEGSNQLMSLSVMAERTLGPFGESASVFTYSFLSYTLMVAYISKSGDVLSPLMHISPSFGCWAFTIAVGGIVLLGGTKIADTFNQMLTATLIGLFILIILQGCTIGDWSGLEHMNWEGTPGIIPLLLFALVYHDLIPVLCAYLRGDIQQIQLAVLIGSVFALIMFVAWEAVIVAIAPNAGGEDPLNYLIRLGGTDFAAMIDVFSILAIATSLVGTLLGFMQFFEERISRMPKGASKKKDLFGVYAISLAKCINSNSHKNSSKFGCHLDLYKELSRTTIQFSSFVLILAPALAASMMVSDAFLYATNITGGYLMALLYGLLPPIMAWSLYKKGILPVEDKVESLFALSKPQVHAILTASGTCAVGVILNQLVLDLNLWP